MVGAKGWNVRVAEDNRIGGRVRLGHEQVRVEEPLHPAGALLLPEQQRTLPIPETRLQSLQARGCREGCLSLVLFTRHTSRENGF
jgi:hypothetical protein